MRRVVAVAAAWLRPLALKQFGRGEAVRILNQATTMPRMLAMGSTGKEVVRLQELLNEKLPFARPRLATDGIFGPKTLARVTEFQTATGLVADGFVGPQTWAALEAAYSGIVPERTGCDCGQHDPANRGMGKFVKSLYFQMVNAATALGLGAFDSDSVAYSTVFIADKTGAQGRPFTMALPDTNQTVQIINAGTFAPKDRTLIQEVMHVWQSQHHSDKYAFMKAAVQCQATAAAAKNAVSSKNTTSLTRTQAGDRRTAGIVY